MSTNSSKSLTVYSQIDEGSFGKIYLVRKNGGIDDGKTYAMKTIESNPLIENQHQICHNELKVLKMMYGVPFIVQLQYAIKTRHFYNLIMDYMPAGNLFDYLQENQLKLTLAQTTICCAEIVLAIQYLHERRIVYRDLKLENILISDDKHILLADFGLARKIRDDERLTDEAGTVAYFAPEMLNSNKGHSFEVDWWSLGIIAYELLIGHTPFLSSLSEKISDRLHRTRIQNEDPRMVKLRSIGRNVDKVSDLIQKLLIKEPELRLGAGQTGYKAVKEHSFFSQLNWTAVKLKLYKCLEKVPARDIGIDFSQQYEMSLEEPQELRRKQFHFIAPHLEDGNITFTGFTQEDLNAMPTKIPLELPEYHIQLKTDLFIRTTAPVENIKQLIIPKRMVRFAETPETIPEVNIGPIRTKQQKSGQRHSPYVTETDTGTRRSERVAKKRTTRSNSLSQDIP